jgi:hypothetical protein
MVAMTTIKASQPTHRAAPPHHDSCGRVSSSSLIATSQLTINPEPKRTVHTQIGFFGRITHSEWGSAGSLLLKWARDHRLGQRLPMGVAVSLIASDTSIETALEPVKLFQCIV